MSFEAFAWAARQRVTSTQKLVLLMLAERHNKDTGQCRPSHDTLADDCGLTRRSVIDQIGRLADAGYITVLARANGNVKLPNQYLLNFHFGVQAKPKAPDHDPYLVVNDVHHPSEPGSPGVVNDVPEVVNDVHQGSERRAHEPGIQPGIEPKSRKKRASAPAAQPAELDFSSWPSPPSPQVLGDWLHLRRQRRAPVTPTVLASFGTELHLAAQMGFSVDDCLTKCCNRNWQGFEAAWLARDTPTNHRNAGANHAIVHPGSADHVTQLRQQYEREQGGGGHAGGAGIVDGEFTVVR